jgi:spore coat protein U-like protein
MGTMGDVSVFMKNINEKKNLHKTYIWLICICAMFFVSQNAQAKCNGETCTCDVTADSFSFGEYTPFENHSVDSTSTIKVTCSASDSFRARYVISLMTGNSGSYRVRKMSSGRSFLQYNLYTGPSHRVVWGNGSQGSKRVTGRSSGSRAVTKEFTLYGRIPSNQNVPVGFYSDTIVVGIDF